MSLRIILRPLVEIDQSLPEMLKERLQQTFNLPVEIKTKITPLDYAYDRARGQYRSPLILSRLRRFPKDPDDWCLGIVDVDLYSPGYEFIFGEADFQSGVAIISLARLNPEYYGLPPNAKLFQERALKEAVHELGHLGYLGHCPNAGCVMHFSNSLADTDIKQTVFCAKCQRKLEENLAS